MPDPSPTVPVSSIGHEPVTGQADDPSGKAEEKGQFKSIEQLRSDRYELQTKHIENEHKLRFKAFEYFFWLLASWLIFDAVALVATGTLHACGYEFLSDNVLIAVLGVATANVIGLLMVAAGYLFPKTPWWLAPTHREMTSLKIETEDAER